ncbi:peptidoglycan DD-metalloendopeptidase family protein [Ramlibacter sp.]|uniref:M23 family metallopeptidase n=1 Tax=Ramlibacter sp. TaxID=1917967 RepID=UPI003D14E3AE
MNNGLWTTTRRLVERTAHALEHHPKHVTALVAALLLCGGGGAFAVASLGPAPEIPPPLRQVVETVEPATPLASQVEALDAFRFALFRTDTVRGSDTVESLLARLGVNDPAAASFLRTDNIFRTWLLGRPGQTITAEASDDHSLLKLVARWATDERSFQRVVISRDAQGKFAARMETGALVASQRVGSGVVRQTLFGAVDEAGIPEAVTMQLVEMFSGAIDFHRGLKKGDRFSVVYETLEGDGEALRTGRVVSAEYVNNGRAHQGVWFETPGMPGRYYDLNGQNLDRAYLASPVAISRITSGFAMRFHPVHHMWKKHMGVDYGGPIGTPVRTIGDGVVQFAGVQGGYGNVITISHGDGDHTLYAHLSRIDVRVGQKVARGQHIGAIGATGIVTGPHLHFEFRENGVHKDPLQAMRQSQGVALTAQARADFDKLASTMRSHLATVSAVSLVASAR